MEVSCKDLSGCLDQDPDAYYLLDVREESEFDICRLENSVNIPMGSLQNALEDLQDVEKKTIVVCHHGVRSLKVTAWLRHNGIDAYSLKGGLDLWATEIDPKMRKY